MVYELFMKDGDSYICFDLKTVISVYHTHWHVYRELLRIKVRMKQKGENYDSKCSG